MFDWVGFETAPVSTTSVFLKAIYYIACRRKYIVFRQRRHLQVYDKKQQLRQTFNGVTPVRVKKKRRRRRRKTRRWRRRREKRRKERRKTRRGRRRGQEKRRKERRRWKERRRRKERRRKKRRTKRKRRRGKKMGKKKRRRKTKWRKRRSRRARTNRLAAGSRISKNRRITQIETCLRVAFLPILTTPRDHIKMQMHIHPSSSLPLRSTTLDRHSRTAIPEGITAEPSTVIAGKAFEKLPSQCDNHDNIRLCTTWKNSQRQLPAQFGCGGPLSRAARPVQTARRIEIGLQQRSLELEASLVHSDDRPYQLHSSRNLKKEDSPPTILVRLPSGSASSEPNGVLAVFPGSILHLECLFSRRVGKPEWSWTSKYRSYLTVTRLDFRSAHAFSMKLACAKELMGRALRLSSPEYREANKTQVGDMLRVNGYPRALVGRLMAEWSSGAASPRPGQSGDTDSHTADADVSPKIFMGLTYVQGISPKLKVALQKDLSNVKVVFKYSNKISRLHTRLKDKDPIQLQSGVVYKVNCRNCSACYIGHTISYIKVRMARHNRDCRNEQEEGTMLSQHAIEMGHTFDFENVSIQDREQKRGRRELKEKLHILLNDNCCNKKTDVNGVSSVYAGILADIKAART
ncbi:unnamed protein product [Nesidiocoris tenuis]|uniref:Helix-turn-helix domain-containing protein n=1 Tax=Nesidiocoris tenuis TaxID=355587 RepID=A0A6H5G517_9HEMI|nr:unnamed protein product [Nesidiocoris tenuis]